MRKLIGRVSLFFIITIYSVGAGNNYSSTWKVNGISEDGSVMIVYKSLAPLSLAVESPKTMRIPKSTKSFKYSSVTGGKPLKITAGTKYNDSIQNEVDKNIIRTIYNSVKFSFESNYRSKLNNFKLDYFPEKGEDHAADTSGNNNDNLKKYIDGRAYFTNQTPSVDLGETYEVELSDNIGGKGTLTAEAYMDAEFTVPDTTELLGGETYKGVIRLKAEFLGNNRMPL